MTHDPCRKSAPSVSSRSSTSGRSLLISVAVALGAASVSLFAWSQDSVGSSDSKPRTRVSHAQAIPRTESSVAAHEQAIGSGPDLGMPTDDEEPAEEVSNGDSPPAPGSLEHFEIVDEMTQSVEEDLRSIEVRIAEARAAGGSASDPDLARLQERRDKFTRNLELRRWAASIDRARAEGREIPPPPPGLARPFAHEGQLDRP